MTRRRLVLGGLVWAFFSAVLAAPALASDGVLEINQTCAVETGCFAGDAPGFPVTISAPGGSYRLTGDLVLPNADTTGVDIQANAVRLDLNGFAVRGPTTCPALGNPPTPSCSPTGTGIGVSNLGPFVGGRVSNGVVMGAGFIGIAMGFVASVEDVIVFGNGGDGVFLGQGSRIERCQIAQNGGDGLDAQAQISVRDCLSLGNAGNGFRLGASAQVESSKAADNAQLGIEAASGSIVSGNQVVANRSGGILALDGAVVAGNVVRANTGSGIEVGDRSRVADNAITDNSTNGIRAGDLTLVEHNAIGSSGARGIFGDFDLLVESNTVGLSGTDGIYMERGVVVGNVVRGAGEEGIEFLTSGKASENQVVGANTGILRARSVESNWVTGNTLNGIETGRNAQVRGNHVEGNGFGIFTGSAGTGAAVQDNQIADNPGGTYGGVVVDLGGNACDGSSTCP